MKHTKSHLVQGWYILESMWLQINEPDLAFFGSLVVSLHHSKCYTLQSFQLFQSLHFSLSPPIVHIYLYNF